MAQNRITYKEASENLRNEIRNRVSVSDLVASYGVPLRRIGSEMVGHCPLPSHERGSGAGPGSFHVRENDKFWNCFGCGAHGDAIEFVKRMDGIGYQEAALKVAEMNGIDTREFKKAIERAAYFRKRRVSKNGKRAVDKGEQRALELEQREGMQQGFGALFGKKGKQSGRNGRASNPAKDADRAARHDPKARNLHREVKSSFLSWEDARKLGWSEEKYRDKKAAFEEKHKHGAPSAERKEGPDASAKKASDGPKVRLNAIAKEVGLKPAVLLSMMQGVEEPVKSHASYLAPAQADLARQLAGNLKSLRESDPGLSDEEAAAKVATDHLETGMLEETTTDIVPAEQDVVDGSAKRAPVQERLDFGVTEVNVDHSVDENGLPVVPRNTVVVNLLGGPGCGKSTLAHEVVSEIKKHGFTVGFVGEYASELIMQGRGAELREGGLPIQQEIFAVQYDRVSALDGKVDFIVTESPSILSTFYLKESPSVAKEFAECVENDYRLHNNFTCFVKRDEDYTPDGRLQTREEAVAIDDRIKEWMRKEHIKGTYRQDAGDLIARNAERYYAKLHGIETVQHPELIEDIKPPAGAWNCLRNDAMELAESNVRAERGFRHLSTEDQAERIATARADAAASIDGIREQGLRPSEARLAISEMKSVELSSFARAKAASKETEAAKRGEDKQADRKLAAAHAER